jgi:hypothetical protein
MPLKIFAGVVATVLMVVYMLAPVIKLKDVALGAVVLIGVVLMLIDLWQSIREGD